MKYLLPFVLILLLLSCEEELPVPKPPTYLRLELPDHSYQTYDSSEWYSFELSEQYTYKKGPEGSDSSHNAVIELGPLNGSIYLHFWKINRPLSYYINNANDEVDRHKIKANRINDEKILRNHQRVFGTFFSLEGDVATPYQFYLTDSTNRFMYGEVLFNSRPNFDSLKPTLEYLKTDLDKLFETFEWKQ